MLGVLCPHMWHQNTKDEALMTLLIAYGLLGIMERKRS